MTHTCFTVANIDLSATSNTCRTMLTLGKESSVTDVELKPRTAYRWFSSAARSVPIAKAIAAPIEGVSGNEDVAASAVVVLLEFLNHSFHEFLAFLEPGAVMKRVRRNSLVVPVVLEAAFLVATDGDDEARGHSARVLDRCGRLGGN